jgi:hypothetical protein
MKIRWYTLGELRGVDKISFREGQGIEAYTKELGNGLRFWITADALIICATILALAMDLLSVTVSISVVLLVILAPIVMTGGYLLGAVSRGFSTLIVIREALQQMFVR